MDVATYLTFWYKGNFLKKHIITNRYASIYEIPFSDLKRKGISLIVFDFDDTLDEFHSEKSNVKTMQLLKEVRNMGMRIAIFSNCSEERNAIIQNIFQDTDFYLVNRSDKPHIGGYNEILAHYAVTADSACMVGDRIGTDLFGAYLAKFSERILVQSYSSVYGGMKARFFDRAIKSFERLFF